MISEYISKLEQKIDLTYTQMNEIMSEVLSGKTNDDENASFLSNLSKKDLLKGIEEINLSYKKTIKFSDKLICLIL